MMQSVKNISATRAVFLYFQWITFLFISKGMNIAETSPRSYKVVGLIDWIVFYAVSAIF